MTQFALLCCSNVEVKRFYFFWKGEFYGWSPHLPLGSWLRHYIMVSGVFHIYSYSDENCDFYWIYLDKVYKNILFVSLYINIL